MSRELTLEMDAFGVQAFTELADREGGSTSRALRVAAHYYLGDSENERPVWPVPNCPDGATSESPPAGIRVEVDQATWSGLVREARRQRVATGALASHAVLYFIADLDSGRVAQRMGDALWDGPGQ
jgi:hypothetical protein